MIREMTKGDLRWIENWQPKGVNEDMKENKKYANKGGSYPLVGKLLKLKYRINDAYHNGGSSFKNIGDKKWVMNLISDVRNNNITKLCKEDILHCNGLWKKYE
tara:strand:+ start:419 stop:727 length:309 start_codon:yes stop_codon:yes gene_type:complete